MRGQFRVVDLQAKFRIGKICQNFPTLPQFVAQVLAKMAELAVSCQMGRTHVLVRMVLVEIIAIKDCSSHYL